VERIVTGNATGDAGDELVVTLIPPRGVRWEVAHFAVRSPNWRSGPLPLRVFVEDRFVCASRQGWEDSADGAPVYVSSGERLRFVFSAGEMVMPATGLQVVADAHVREQRVGP
jgi:hypothetical protein